MPKKSAHRSGWKTAQKRTKKNSRIKLALLVLAAVVLVLIFGQIIRLANTLVHPLSGAEFKKNYTWNGKSSINVVLKSDNVSLLSFDPKAGQVKIVNIPDETYIETPGHGSWQLRAIYDLGGAALIKSSISDFLGLPVDGVIIFDGPFKNSQPKEIVEGWRKSPLAAIFSTSNIKTDLSPVELMPLVFGISRIRYDKLEEVDLGEANLLSSGNLPDGTQALIADPVKVDGFVASQLSEAQMKTEGISIAIYNGTSHPGLAQKAARVVTNMGGNVIISGNLDSEIAKSFVISDGKDSYTEKRLKQIFSPGCLSGPKCAILDNSLTNSRAQIKVILGEDYYSQ
jgi:hypothetical protein